MPSPNENLSVDLYNYVYKQCFKTFDPEVA